MPRFDILRHDKGSLNKYALIATNVPARILGDFLSDVMNPRGPNNDPYRHGPSFSMTVHLHPTYWGTQSLIHYPTEDFSHVADE